MNRFCCMSLKRLSFRFSNRHHTHLNKHSVQPSWRKLTAGHEPIHEAVPAPTSLAHVTPDHILHPCYNLMKYCNCCRGDGTCVIASLLESLFGKQVLSEITVFPSERLNWAYPTSICVTPAVVLRQIIRRHMSTWSSW